MLTLRAPDVRLDIEPAAGGRLASLRVGANELLVGPAGPDDRGLTWGCYLMAPWPGRLADGRLAWAGRTLQLPRTFGRHAIHGLLWDRPWDVERATATSAALSCRLPAEWPMGGHVRQQITLAEDRLTLTAAITAGSRMPAALGWHPWFDRRGLPVRLELDAASVLETSDMIPTGRVLAATGPLDLRGGPVLGNRRLDDAYLDARSPAVLEWPDLRLTLDFSPAPGPVVVYTPEHAVCVEPQTATPNALALPEAHAAAAGVRFLDAGGTFEARLSLSWR